MAFTPKISARVSRRSGFSLVLSLVVMAMLLLLCVSAAAMLTIELRAARVGIAYAKARLNAIASARTALGTLQGLAGNDRRITAPSSLLDTNPATSEKSEGVENPHIMGVWKGKSLPAGGANPANPDYKQEHKSAFVGWLTSGSPTLPDPDYPKRALAPANSVRLFRAPSTAPGHAPGLTDDDPASVSATTESFPESGGKFAWWIADENQKANASLRISAPGQADGQSTPLQNAQNAPCFGLKLAGDGDFAAFPVTQRFNPLSRSSFELDGPAGDAWLKDTRNYFHDITHHSESLLTDVVNGGLKYDLSLLFTMDKLPDDYRGDTGYVGLEGLAPTASPRTKAKAGWLLGPNAAPTTLSGQLNGMYTTDPNYVTHRTEWTCWGDVWNYARLYKNTGLLTTAGMKAPLGAEQCLGGTPPNTTNRNPFDPNNNVTDVRNMSAWRIPVISRIQFTLLAKRVPVTPANGKYTLQIIVRPYVQIWNPYNVPLILQRANLERLYYLIGKQLPGKVQITTKDSTAGIKNYNNYAGSGATGPWQQLFGGPVTFLQTYIEIAPSGETLAPGEVRTYSPASSATTTSPNWLELKAGSMRQGGYAIDIPASRIAPFDGEVQLNMAPSTLAEWSGNNSQFHISRGPSGVAQWATGMGIYQTAVPVTGPREDLNCYDTTPKTIPANSVTEEAFALLSIRLRSETGYHVDYPNGRAPRQKAPAFTIGDPLRLVINGWTNGSDYRKSPAIFLYPYEVVHAKANDDESFPDENPDMLTTDAQGYAFTGYTIAHGMPNMIFCHIPLAPLASMSELTHARLGGGAAYTRQSIIANNGLISKNNTGNLTGSATVPNAFGNSFAHCMVPKTQIAQYADRTWSAGDPNNTFCDYSWIMNSALWDSYCMTTLCPQDSQFKEFLPSGSSKPLGVVADDFFIKGKSLANPGMLLRDYGIGGVEMKKLVVNGDLPTADGFTKSAGMMSVNGGFNVNSTSVRAWRSLLAGLNSATLPTLQQNTPTVTPKSVSVAATDNPVLRAPVQTGDTLAPVNSGTYPGDVSDEFQNRRLLAGRKLSDAQLTKLAQKIVEQVKKRGPFLSLGEFMNRRLENNEFGNKGALQAAIDDSGINDFATKAPARQITDADVASLVPALPNKDAIIDPVTKLGPAGRGLPGYVTQADLVGPVASRLTARGDTFVIRACGISEEGVLAHVELTVRRTIPYLDTADKPDETVATKSGFKTANKAFGRRFAIVASRWLNEKEL